MPTFEFHGNTVEFDTLPDQSKAALLSRVAGHFNNEAASATINWSKTQIVNGTDRKASDVETADARAWREAHPDETKAFVESWFADKHAALLAGSLGVREAGTGGIDPLTREMHAIALQEIKDNLRKGGLKIPKGDQTVNLPDGAFTMAQLIERRLGGRHAERIETAAKRALANRAKSAAGAGGVEDL